MRPVRVVRGVVVFFLGWLLATTACAAADVPKHFFLEIDIVNERGGAIAVLFDFGDDIWGENSASAEVQARGGLQTVRLHLPARPIRRLRFDPAPHNGSVLIAGMRLLDDRGERLLTIDPRTLRPMHQIRAIAPEGDGVRVHPTEDANDPQLRLEFGRVQQRMHEAAKRPTVGRGAVVLLGLVIGAALAAAVWAAWRALGATATAGGVSVWVGGLGIFLVVFGARAMALNFFSRPLPYWDEWEGDALYILIPFVGGFLDWGALVMPQWEHRILLTRTITLFGTLLNGEWDPRVAMTVSAAMFAATAAVVGMALLATRRASGAVAAGALAAGMALPFDVNNLLWGGQTQMYGLVLLAICTLGLAAAPRVTPLVAIGALAGSWLSLFTMGAGPVGPGCAVGICLVRCWCEREQRRALTGLAAIFFTAALAGVFLHVSSRAHVPLYANSWAQFQRAFVGVLAWPLTPHVFWAALLWAPWVVNGVLILRRRAATPLEWLAVGLGAWGLINAVALGYARQYEGPPFDTRFFTSFTVGVLGSIASSVALWQRARTAKARLLPALAWAAAAVGLLAVGEKGIGGAREAHAARAESEHRVREYLSTGDYTRLNEKPSHHTGMVVVARLDEPLLQQVLPAPFRRALAARSGDAAARNIEAGPVTLTARTLMKAGPFIALAGLAIFGWAAWRGRTRREENGNAGGVRGALARWRVWPREVRIDRACYAAAVAVTVAWTFVYHAVQKHGLVDEPGHIAALHHFLDQKSGWPEAMPMLPGYHFMVLSLWKLHPAMSTLAAARFTTMLTTLVGLAAFALVWRRLHERPAGRATLLLALLPLTQPFAGMAYSDMPALAFALVAWWAQVTGRRAFAALALAGAVGIRQTNLAWAGFFVLWEFFRTDEPRQTWLRRVAWQLLLLALAAGVIVATGGRLTVGTQHGNQFVFNIATVHVSALLVLVFGLPVWLAHARGLWARGREAARAAPVRFETGLALGLVATIGLTLTFANPHIWNRELFWEGCSFTLLRNWPLVWSDRHFWLRAASALNVVLMAVALARVFAGQRHRRALWLAAVFGALPVATNGLVEPRYLIPAAGFILSLLDVGDGADWRRLAWWWGALSAVHAPFVARALSLW